MKVLIVGAGNMGKTYTRSFLASRFIAPADLYILEKAAKDGSPVKEIADSNVHNDTGKFISEVDIIMLCVKPQDFPSLGEQLKPFIQPDQTILSIMAGIKMQTIIKSLNSKKVVRSMPNLPAQIGMGMTVFTSSPAIDKKELFIIQNLINTTGKSVYVEEENMIDAATAISGSGPAYVYYFMQAMVDAGVKMGFTFSQAELLVNQTFMGALHLHNQSELSCEEWIKRVASKGGTTEAALNVLEKHSVNTNIDAALYAAYYRAKELGN
jgi:pyrroline-5-carboxylate reductase